MKYPIWEGRNVLCSLLRKTKCIFYMSQMQAYSIQVKNLSEIFFFFFPSNQQLKKSTQRLKWMSHFGQKSFIYTSVNNSIDVSYYHTQDFAITVLLHHIETSGTELFRNMLSFYSVIIIVLCLLCISDLYLTLPVCLDKKTSFKPQLPSVSLILPQ